MLVPSSENEISIAEKDYKGKEGNVAKKRISRAKETEGERDSIPPSKKYLINTI